MARTIFLFWLYSFIQCVLVWTFNITVFPVDKCRTPFHCDPFKFFQQFHDSISLAIFIIPSLVYAYLLSMSYFEKTISECWFLYTTTLLNLSIVLEVFWYSLVIFRACHLLSNWMPLFLSFAWLLWLRLGVQIWMEGAKVASLSCSKR